MKNLFVAVTGTLLPALFLAGVFVSNVTYNVPEGNYNGYMGTLKPMTGKPHNTAEFVPTKGCVSEVKFADTLLVMDYDADVMPMSYDEVERRQRSKTWADNVWVIGSC